MSIDGGSSLKYNDTNVVEFIGEECDESGQTFVRTTKCIPTSKSSYQFEVYIRNGGRGDDLVVGLSTLNAKQAPGKEDNTIGFYGNGKIVQNGKDIICEEGFETGDFISCQVVEVKVQIADNVFTEYVCQFWKNGVYIGPPSKMTGRVLFPSVGLNSPGAMVDVNLGAKPFKYKLGNHMLLLNNNLITLLWHL